MSEVGQLISLLGLAPLPREGGWFARTWTGPAGPDGRPAGTSILYLLAPGAVSAPHRLPRDEVWHFHAGDAVELLLLDPAGGGRRVRLGPAVFAGDAPQAVAPAGWWQGARVAPGGRWALVGCTLAPGWRDDDFEPGDVAALQRSHPAFAADLAALAADS